MRGRLQGVLMRADARKGAGMDMGMGWDICFQLRRWLYCWRAKTERETCGEGSSISALLSRKNQPAGAVHTRFQVLAMSLMAAAVQSRLTLGLGYMVRAGSGEERRAVWSSMYGKIDVIKGR